MTPVHAITATQKIVMDPLRSCGMMAKGAAQYMIPVSTGAAKVIPVLTGNSLAWLPCLCSQCVGHGSDLPSGENCQI